jgi:hypothetical protein
MHGFHSLRKNPTLPRHCRKNPHPRQRRPGSPHSKKLALSPPDPPYTSALDSFRKYFHLSHFGHNFKASGQTSTALKGPGFQPWRERSGAKRVPWFGHSRAPAKRAPRGIEPLAFRPNFPKFAETPKCGKSVKRFAHGTKVLSLILKDLHRSNRKEFWRESSPDLVY